MTTSNVTTDAISLPKTDYEVFKLNPKAELPALQDAIHKRLQQAVAMLQIMTGEDTTEFSIMNEELQSYYIWNIETLVEESDALAQMMYQIGSAAQRRKEAEPT